MLELRYEELVADIDGIVWEAEAETLQFTFVSPRGERWLGYPLERAHRRRFGTRPRGPRLIRRSSASSTA